MYIFFTKNVYHVIPISGYQLCPKFPDSSILGRFASNFVCLAYLQGLIWFRVYKSSFFFLAAKKNEANHAVASEVGKMASLLSINPSDSVCIRFVHIFAFICN